MTNTPISFDVLHGTKFWFFLIIIFILNIMNLFILHYLSETGLQSTADWVEAQRQTVLTAFVGGILKHKPRLTEWYQVALEEWKVLWIIY